ncbi:hypothetical protein SHJG_0709 [Streptomyces hygroscopicus subsp. jinggangensis 5008]|nr:hypothetical protein SHJG_0709 [Streptomyces hygroscopicus subsp. jinggangensis 5008]AGF60208.1 hypothetical protein SHJGH_0542 [Streptomyces hygroscopicus subsp. jinggangensis TL01]
MLSALPRPRWNSPKRRLVTGRVGLPVAGPAPDAAALPGALAVVGLLAVAQTMVAAAAAPDPAGWSTRAEQGDFASAVRLVGQAM